MMNLYSYHTNPETLYGYESMKRFIKPSVEMVYQMFADGYSFQNVPYNMITYLPDGLYVGESFDLYLNNTPITHLPDGLVVNGNLDLYNTDITYLPYGLTVNGYLDITSSAIVHIGDGLYVGGDFILDDTPYLDKDNLPSDMIVEGNIIK